MFQKVICNYALLSRASPGMHRMVALLALQLSWALVPDETPAIGEDIDVAAPLPYSRFKGTDAPPVDVSSEGTDTPPFELSFEGTDSGARRQLNHYSTRIDAGECIRLAHNESLYSERILSFIGFWVPEGIKHGSLPRAQGNAAEWNFLASRTYEEWEQDSAERFARINYGNSANSPKTHHHSELLLVVLDAPVLGPLAERPGTPKT